MTETIIERKIRSGYVEITLEEMKNFLEPLGFIMHKRDSQTEWVANKIFSYDRKLYLVRVYTSINPEERSRGSGSDALRVTMFTSNGEWVFGTKRANRTKNWREAIKTRIKELEDKIVVRIDEENKNIKEIKQV